MLGCSHSRRSEGGDGRAQTHGRSDDKEERWVMLCGMMSAEVHNYMYIPGRTTLGNTL
jgi:hypothetical protein